ncbi:DUF5359 family protein [Paenibacillus sp. Marseille-Q4541]|uniref:DUF5359 family protein n=1 Tax=Paenibacillus sp. Marseille-Q4541 TaxID=2831522 RepID=UPI001BA6E7B6|nr:DUF5359 family protein [Paenibacillus sp. Marseille-Q4541]
MMKQHDQATQKYEALFKQFSNQVESFFKKLLFCLLLLLLVFQILLHNRYTAPLLSAVIRLEGTPLPAAFSTPNRVDKE